ncbi:hypothetical protein HDU76_010071 [Blyttiomyces sp. JEL0837]|nr:hypothetical protein HDU76_010071 [Blyttiomyces sp. JEL0837]
MSSKKQDVLARYLSTAYIPEGLPTDPSKKKKKKKKSHSGHVLGATTRIMDDDDDFGGNAGSDDEEMKPVVVEGLLEESSRFTSNSWAVIREGEGGNGNGLKPEDESINVVPATTSTDDGSAAKVKVKKKKKKTTTLTGADNSADYADGVDPDALTEEEKQRLLKQLQAHGDGAMETANTVEDMKKMMEEQGFQVVLDDGVDLNASMDIQHAPAEALLIKTQQNEATAASLGKHRVMATQSERRDRRRDDDDDRRERRRGDGDRRDRDRGRDRDDDDERGGRDRRRRSPSFSSDEERDRRDRSSGKSGRRRTPLPFSDEDDDRRKRRRRTPSVSSDEDQPRKRNSDEADDTGHQNKKRMADGTLAGLQTAEAVRKSHEERRRAELERLSKLDPSLHLP